MEAPCEVCGCKTNQSCPLCVKKGKSWHCCKKCEKSKKYTKHYMTHMKMTQAKAPATVDGEKRMEPELSNSDDYDSDESEGKPLTKRPFKAAELALIRNSGVFNDWVAPKDVEKLGVGVDKDTLFNVRKKVKGVWHTPVAVKDLKSWYKDHEEDRKMLKNTLVFKPEIWIDLWKSNVKLMIWTLFDLVIKDYGFIVKDQTKQKTVYFHDDDWQGEAIEDTPVQNVGDANSKYTLWIQFKSLPDTEIYESEYRYLRSAWTALHNVLNIDREHVSSEKERAVVEFIKERCYAEGVGRYWPSKVGFNADSAVNVLKATQAAALLAVNMPYEKLDVALFYYSPKALMLLRERRKVKIPRD
jgi:hypothetical protein